ncbi:VgrG-related protein [Cyanobacteria bacterium FACHB-63]|nr:VgrG-related protein [Cyanobacteria bacterium FACHB-63]
MTTSAPRYVSVPLIKLNGSPASDDFMKDILKIVVEESLHLPAMFTLVIHNNYIPTVKENQPWRHQKELEIGKQITIGFGNSLTQDPNFDKPKQDGLIEGEITAIDINFTNRSESHLIVRGYDLSHRLHRGRFNRSFQNMTDSAIVKKIAQEVGLAATCEPTGAAREYVFQKNQTNMEFLRELAARQGFELFVQNGKLQFRKPKSQKQLQLKWLQDINQFTVRVTSAQQVSSVEVRSWDYGNKRSIVETARNEKIVTDTEHKQGSRTAQKFSIPAPKMTIVDRPVFSADEAQRMAQSLCDELGGEFVYADAKTDGNGNPELRPGRVVELADIGKYSGKYYITETRHVYHERVYSTDFSVRGLRDGSLLSMLAPSTHLHPSQTLMVGIVTNNKDPKGWGRVKVRLPTLTEDHESHWARVVSIGAGKDRGFDCLPEVNDEVLVGFEHGDIHRPYVIGGVWNGKDSPPEQIDDSLQGGKVRLRTIKTRTGHTIQFVEEDKGSSKDGVYIQTAGGHQIQLNDSDRSIQIKTNGGHQVKLDDMGQSITIKSTLNLKIEAQGNIDINATGIITIKGAMIHLN